MSESESMSQEIHQNNNLAEIIEQRKLGVKIGREDGLRFVQMVADKSRKTVMPGSDLLQSAISDWFDHAVLDNRISSSMKESYEVGFVDSYSKGYGYRND